MVKQCCRLPCMHGEVGTCSSSAESAETQDMMKGPTPPQVAPKQSDSTESTFNPVNSAFPLGDRPPPPLPPPSPPLAKHCPLPSLPSSNLTPSSSPFKLQITSTNTGRLDPDNLHHHIKQFGSKTRMQPISMPQHATRIAALSVGQVNYSYL